jgi:Flp pilus assembly protein TadG
MTVSTKDPTRATRRRCRDDSGAALIEFSFVAILLLTLVFGIITFGMLLSFKQDLTRAAAEGARAGAVAVPGTEDSAKGAAELATKDAVDGAGKACTTTDGVDSDGDGLACHVTFGACQEAAGDNCVTVELTYDQKGKPLLGPVPLVSALLPDTVTSRSVAMVNDVVAP